jgi:hypothetical protein
MSITSQIAKHVRDVHFGGNWTDSDLKMHLADVTWQEATTKIQDFNTIATLVFHANYYVSGILPVLQGGTLEISDKFAFTHPPINSEADWQKMLEKTWSEAEIFANLVEKLPDSKLAETFIDEKYGNYFRNLQGIIEHTHYHLGQIVFLKKILRA